jgi:hypothetical protein
MAGRLAIEQDRAAGFLPPVRQDGGNRYGSGCHDLRHLGGTEEFIVLGRAWYLVVPITRISATALYDHVDRDSLADDMAPQPEQVLRLEGAGIEVQGDRQERWSPARPGSAAARSDKTPAWLIGGNIF